jgi:hypothetical protein
VASELFRGGACGVGGEFSVEGEQQGSVAVVEPGRRADEGVCVVGADATRSELSRHRGDLAERVGAP